MRTLLFLGLKIIELIGMVAVYLGLCRLGWWLAAAEPTGYIWYNPVHLLFGLVPFMLLFVAVSAFYLIVMILIPEWISSNKKLVNKILGDEN